MAPVIGETETAGCLFTALISNSNSTGMGEDKTKFLRLLQ